ncbi:transposase, MuDR [Tanacetum coccineum]
MVDFEKCSLRPPGKSFDPVEAYGSKNPTLFTLKINHGGFFTLRSPRRYMNGKVNCFDGVDSDEFSIHELSEMLKLLCYKNESMFYHFKIPNSGLDLGLKPLVSNSDVTDMVKQVGSIKVIEVYIELWLSAIDYESMSNPAKMSTIDTDVPKSMSNPLPMKKIGFASKPKKKFIKKLSKKALSKEVFKQWDGGVDVVQIGKEQGVDAVDIGKESKNGPSHFDMTNDFDPFLRITSIEDVQVDMGDFRRKYNKNSKWEGFIEHQIEKNDDFEDEELNLEDFDSYLWDVMNGMKNDFSSALVVEWNGDDKYQVIRPKGYQCVVNMSTKVCTCRRWELTRIPCKHAAAAINDMGNNGMGNNGMYYVPIELIPPKHHPQVGRPPKKRNKSAMEVEEMEKHGKLTRARKTVRCLLCKQIGHNRRSCKGQTIETKTNPGNKKRKIASQGKSSSQPPPISSPVRPLQGIVIRDSPSANTRSSRLQVSS